MRFEYKRDYELFPVYPASFISNGLIDVLEVNAKGRWECVARLAFDILDCSRVKEDGVFSLLDVCESASANWLHIHSTFFDRRGVLLSEMDHIGGFQTIVLVRKFTILPIAKEYELVIIYNALRLNGALTLFTIPQAMTSAPKATLSKLGFKRISNSSLFVSNNAIMETLSFPLEKQEMLALDPNHDYTLELDCQWRAQLGLQY